MTDFLNLDYAEQCSAAIVTLKNGALKFKGSLQGMYQISDLIDGKPSWTSVSNAIWYILEYDAWSIATLDYIGDSAAYMFAFDIYGGLDDTNNQWKYWDGSNWILASANDIFINCTSKYIF